MSESSITIIGNVVDEVVLKATDAGVARVSFRVAQTQRRKDRETGEWTDGRKLFVNITFWRDFAENVALSIKKGDPIVVRGKLYSKQYVKDENNRVSYEIEPESIGHDLSRGVAKFERRKRGLSGSVVLDPDGLPERTDDVGEYEMLSDPSGDFAPAEQIPGRTLATAS